MMKQLLMFVISNVLLSFSPLTRYKHYERWATANDFPVENVVNDGSTTLDDRLGAVADLELVIRSRKLQDDIMVVRGLFCVWVYAGFRSGSTNLLCCQIAGDMLCADQNFDVAQVIRFFRSKVRVQMKGGRNNNNRTGERWLAVSVLQPGELIIYYELEEGERSSSRGIVEVCPDTHRWELSHTSCLKWGRVWFLWRQGR